MYKSILYYLAKSQTKQTIQCATPHNLLKTHPFFIDALHFFIYNLENMFE